MCPHLREFLELCARTLVCPEPIVEIGTFQVPGQEVIVDLRPLFPGKIYMGCDMQPGNSVDRIEDIHHLSFRSGEVGTFILVDTLGARLESISSDARDSSLSAQRWPRDLRPSYEFPYPWIPERLLAIYARGLSAFRIEFCLRSAPIRMQRNAGFDSVSLAGAW